MKYPKSALVAVLLATAGWGIPPASAQTAPLRPTEDSRLLIEDFDRPRGDLTRLESEWGVNPRGTLKISYSHLIREGPVGYSLHLSLDAAATAETKGAPSLRFSLSGRLDDSRVTRNLTPYSELFFVTRGGDTPSPLRFRIELRTLTSGRAFWEEEVAVAPEWQEHHIPLDPARWLAAAGPAIPSFDRIKELSFTLEPGGASGDCYLDRVECLGRHRSIFDWKAASDNDLTDYVEYHTYRFFEDFSDPVTGFTLDRTSNADISSIAAVGFALASHSVATSRGWVTPREGADRVARILRSLRDCSPRASRNGVFYHFLQARSGDPALNSEVSIIDTALLIAGAYIARSYFRSDPEILELATKLIDQVQWGWFFDRDKGQFLMAWSPARRSGYEFADRERVGYFCGGEKGPVHWGTYTDEVALIWILAAASPWGKASSSPFPSADMTPRQYDGITLTASYNGSLFTYLFGSCFLDTRQLGASSGQFDWYGNSTKAIAASRRYAVERKYPDWAFGITACEGPDGLYHNYGAPPASSTTDCDGTVALYGVVGSLLHSRQEVLRSLRSLSPLGVFQEGLGYADAVNPLQVDPKANLPWINWTRFGIDQGTILMILENARTGFAWTQFQSNGGIDSVLTSVFPKRVR